MKLFRSNRVPIPYARRLQRIQHSALPVISFLACVFLSLWLWQRQGQMPNAVGEVEAVRIDVASGSDGVLVSLPHGQWTLFDRVEANTVIACLDDRPIRAEMATLMAELARLRGELDATLEQIQIEQSEREQDHQREYRRLAWQAQKHRLDVLDRRTIIEADRVDEQRLERKIAFLEPLQEKGMVSDMEITDLRLQRDEVRKRIEENEQALAESKQQREATAAALSDFADIRMTSIDKLLRPLEAAITVGERRLDELEVSIDGLEIRSPISGTICAIHKWPGQNLQAGDPVLTVASEHGRYIVSYVRQEQRMRPAVKMPVKLRPHGSRDLLVSAVVERVGPQVELVPPHHRRDAAIPEWGQPVFILPPEKFTLRPGELIDITFNTQRVSDSG